MSSKRFTSQIKGDCHRISCSYKDLPTSVKLNQLIYVSDGDLTFQVVEIGTEFVFVSLR